MRRSQVDSILVEQAKRRNIIFEFTCVIVILSIFCCSLFFAYTQKSKNNYVTYDENSNIDYKVYLKENSYFENNYLGKERQYIASLIDYITADFDYSLEFDSDDVEYRYEYRIDANVTVYDENTDNVLYNKTVEMLPSVEHTTSDKKVNIKESVSVDYHSYNDLVYGFVGLYGLREVESVLTIDMYVNTIGSCDDFEKNEENESVITLAIPLTTQTVAIELSDDLVETENNIMLCKPNKWSFLLLVFAIIIFVIDLVLIIFLARFELKTRTADTIYTKKFKKILNNYGSYIQELSDDFSVKGFQVVKITNFEDLLEIRDTVKQPILMKQNEEKTGAYFVIPTNAKHLYIYRLNIEDIESEMEKENDK